MMKKSFAAKISKNLKNATIKNDGKMTDGAFPSFFSHFQSFSVIFPSLFRHFSVTFPSLFSHFQLDLSYIVGSVGMMIASIFYSPLPFGSI